MDFLALILTIIQKAFYATAGLFGIGFIIGFHELGHFLFCKIFKIQTPSFSIGFGPRILTKKIGDTEFALSAIPLGGYVEIAGNAEVGQGEQKNATAINEQSFAVKPYWQKLLVMIGGISFNVLFAFLALFLLCFTGLPKAELLYPYNATAIIKTVEPDSPAAQYNFQPGDRVIGLNATKINDSVATFLAEIRPLPNQEITIEFERNGVIDNVRLPLGSRTIIGSENPVGTFGAIFELEEKKLGFLASIAQGAFLTKHYLQKTFEAFAHIFAKKDVSNVGGPLMLFSATMSGAAKGFKIFLLFLAIISVNLAILNIIPLPILDGGQILFISIEAIIGRSLPTKIKEYIHIACWVGFLLLTLYLSYQDLSRIAGPYLQQIKTFFGW